MKSPSPPTSYTSRISNTNVDNSTHYVGDSADSNYQTVMNHRMPLLEAMSTHYDHDQRTNTLSFRTSTAMFFPTAQPLNAYGNSGSRMITASRLSTMLQSVLDILDEDDGSEQCTVVHRRFG